MASSPLPEIGDEIAVSEAPKTLRLGDAERIAMRRLDEDVAPEGSLKEALAATPVGNGVESLGDGRDAAPVPGGVAPPAPETREALARERAPSADQQRPDDASEPGSPPPGPATDAAIASTSQPLANALDAAAKLAADANAAAEALENLRRLLAHRLTRASANPAPTLPVEGAGAPNEIPVSPEALPPPVPISPPRAASDEGGLSALEPAVQLPVPSRQMPVEHTLFDVRGFLAGFALSWAIGVVLYLFMTAG